MVHITQVFSINAKVLSAHTRHRESKLDVFGGAHVVDHDAGAKFAHRLNKTRTIRAVERFDLTHQVERGSKPAFIALIHRRGDQLAYAVTHHREPHPSIECRAQKRVCVFEARWFGRHNNQAFVSDEEVVEHRRVHTRSKVEQHKVSLQSPQSAHETHASQMCGLRFAQVCMGAGNHPHTWDRRIENQLAKIVFALRDKIGEARGRCRRPEARVKVCAFKVSVNGDHAVARAR